MDLSLFVDQRLKELGLGQKDPCHLTMTTVRPEFRHGPRAVPIDFA